MEQQESQYLAVGRVYATALYDAAVRSGNIADVTSDIETIAALFAAAPRLNVFLNAATITAVEKLGLIEASLAGSVHALTLAAIHAMARRDRLGMLRAFAVAFETVQRDRNNRLSVKIISARPLAEPERLRIAEAAGRSLGRQVDLSAAVDASLLGGVQLQIGDTFIDGSVKRRLRAMKSKLHTGVITGLKTAGA